MLTVIERWGGLRPKEYELRWTVVYVYRNASTVIMYRWKGGESMLGCRRRVLGGFFTVVNVNRGLLCSAEHIEKSSRLLSLCWKYIRRIIARNFMLQHEVVILAGETLNEICWVMHTINTH